MQKGPEKTHIYIHMSCIYKLYTYMSETCIIKKFVCINRNYTFLDYNYACI